MQGHVGDAAGGDALAAPALEEHDRGLRRSLEQSVGGAIEEHCWRQAKLGCRQAGLGMRCAADLHLAAAVASLTAAVPLAEDMDVSYAEAGVFPAGVLAAAVRERRARAISAAIIFRVQLQLPNSWWSPPTCAIFIFNQSSVFAF